MTQKKGISVGDVVRLIDEEGQGRVLATEGDTLTVLIDGMEFKYDRKDVVRVEHDSLVDQSAGRKPVPQKDQILRETGRQKLEDLEQADKAVYELDLHIDELLEDHRNMSNGEILQYQMRCCRSFLREAREKRYPKVVLIHGVGEGVLKQEIHRFLDAQPKIEYYDAPYRTYGYGATEVRLFH